MALLWCLVYLLVLLLVGAAIACSIIARQRRRISEILALALSLGPGITAATTLWFSLCGLAPGRTIILLIASASIALLITLTLRRRIAIPLLPVRQRRWWLDVLTIPLILMVAAALVEALITTVNEADGPLTPKQYNAKVKKGPSPASAP